MSKSNLSYLLGGTIFFLFCFSSCFKDDMDDSSCLTSGFFSYVSSQVGANGSVVFTIVPPSGGAFGDKATWDFGDGTTLESGEQQVIHTYSENGVYLVLVEYWVVLDEGAGCGLIRELEVEILLE